VSKDEALRMADELLEELQGLLNECLDEFGGYFILFAKQLANQRLKYPGKYPESIYWERGTEPGQAFYGSRHPYAAEIELGVKPHVIEPKERRVLAFFKEGVWKFRRRVEHRARAFHILRDAFEMAKTMLPTILKERLRLG